MPYYMRTYSEVIVHSKSLKVLDKASLQVATTAGFHCCVHQTLYTTHTAEAVDYMSSHLAYLPACHAVEKVLLWPYTCQETSLHKATCTGAGVIRREGGEEAATWHERRSLALQLNLAK